MMGERINKTLDLLMRALFQGRDRMHLIGRLREDKPPGAGFALTGVGFGRGSCCIGLFTRRRVWMVTAAATSLDCPPCP